MQMHGLNRGDEMQELMMNVDRVLAEAMKLDEEERLELADRLTLSLEVNDRVDASRRGELKPWRARLRSGETQAQPWDEVKAELMS